jgi:hypothetical protein
VKYNFGHVQIHDNYVIVIVNEGEVVDKLKNTVLVDIAQSYFKDKPFVYITHRINSYAVDPSVYEATSRIKNLIGFCVVSSNFLAKNNAQVEKLFFNKPFEVFENLPEAINWSNALIEKH